LILHLARLIRRPRGRTPHAVLGISRSARDAIDRVMGHRRQLIRCRMTIVDVFAIARASLCHRALLD
jgi:hypothetical protein